MLDAIRQSPLLSGTLTPEWTFAGIELLVYLFVALCVRDALTSPTVADKDRRRWLAAMACAFLFTLAVETLLSHSFATGPDGKPDLAHRLYTYPSRSFFIQFLDVPIWVPLGWAFIVYATMRTTTLLGLKWYLAPLLDGFLALNLDMTLDPIAVHRGWWTWDVMQDPASAHLSAYFGIPLVNFMGWFVIVGSYSLITRWLWRRADRKGAANPVLPSVGAALLSLPAVAVYQAIANVIMGHEQANPDLFVNGSFVSTLVWVGAFIVLFREAPNFRRDHGLNRTLVGVPWAFHGYCFALLWVTKARVPPALSHGWLVREAGELALFMPISAVLGLWLYYWPYLDRLGHQARAER